MDDVIFEDSNIKHQSPADSPDRVVAPAHLVARNSRRDWHRRNYERRGLRTRELTCPAGHPVDSLQDLVSDGQLDSTSMGSTTVSFKAAGELNDQFQVLTKADAGALVEFSRERAVVIQMRKVTSRRIVPGDLKKWRLC
jgi:hypothetical protein